MEMLPENVYQDLLVVLANRDEMQAGTFNYEGPCWAEGDMVTISDIKNTKDVRLCATSNVHT